MTTVETTEDGGWGWEMREEGILKSFSSRVSNLSSASKMKWMWIGNIKAALVIISVKETVQIHDQQQHFQLFYHCLLPIQQVSSEKYLHCIFHQYGRLKFFCEVKGH